jgi:hypothetical protein
MPQQLLSRLKKLEKKVQIRNHEPAVWTVVCRGRVVDQYPITNKDAGSIAVILPDDFWEDRYHELPSYKADTVGHTIHVGSDDNQ